MYLIVTFLIYFLLILTVSQLKYYNTKTSYPLQKPAYKQVFVFIFNICLVCANIFYAFSKILLTLSSWVTCNF